MHPSLTHPSVRALRGVAVALCILGAWAISFSAAFSTGAEGIGTVGCVLLIPWFTFLYTGLFVTGHDSMHGSVAPSHPRINRLLGELCLFCYGLIPYDKLYESHAHHHQFPASHRDPDFHNGRDTHPILWYFRFMRSYWTLRQTIGIIVIYNGLHRVVGVPEANLLVFWAIPSLLSSVQLFYFGTYLVHRELPDTYSTPLCANSHYWPELLSLITCYHFGYHREHHAFPEVPWWQLPQVELTSCPQTITAKYTTTKMGKTLAAIKRPLVQRDRTRLNT
ncbi:MAG: fatty acid desaturase [Cyanobacteria bacterium P01_F01_bin.3]